jgi:TatA/E family protein of Tat protein translocase
MGIADPTHLFLIAVIALIVIGPRRLPELTHALGRAVHEFRESLHEGHDRAGSDQLAASQADSAPGAQGGQGG